MSAFQFDLCELPPEAHALRAEVRTFLQDDLAAGAWQPQGDFCNHFREEFSQRIGAKGWIGLTWPKQYGGHQRSMLERYVVTEEMLVAGAPVSAHWIADRQSGPLLLRFGTEAQRQRYLPGIARGESYFGIGMSEPDAGSDLASVRTRADKVPGGWKLNGRKVWTTFAHRCHYAITLARSAPATDQRHEGAWDNYQCKQYRTTVPTEVGVREIGKVLYHAHCGHFTPPRRYIFGNRSRRSCELTASSQMLG